MTADLRTHLGRRERQIVEAIYRLRKAGVSEVREALPDPPSYSAVRAMLNSLEEKGYLKHQREGMRYVYVPVLGAKKAQRFALKHLVSTFFQGSPAAAAAALLEMPDAKISQQEKEHLKSLIAQAESEGR